MPGQSHETLAKRSKSCTVWFPEVDKKFIILPLGRILTVEENTVEQIYLTKWLPLLLYISSTFLRVL